MIRHLTAIKHPLALSPLRDGCLKEDQITTQCAAQSQLTGDEPKAAILALPQDFTNTGWSGDIRGFFGTNLQQ